VSRTQTAAQTVGGQLARDRPAHRQASSTQIARVGRSATVIDVSSGPRRISRQPSSSSVEPAATTASGHGAPHRQSTAANAQSAMRSANRSAMAPAAETRADSTATAPSSASHATEIITSSSAHHGPTNIAPTAVSAPRTVINSGGVRSRTSGRAIAHTPRSQNLNAGTEAGSRP